MPLKASEQGLSPYQLHVKKWKEGCESNCCPPVNPDTKVCLGRGQLPCDMLLIGEAPGESENIIGQPFIGPAGHLLNRIIARSLQGLPNIRIAFTNIVGCIPREEDGGKATEPDDDQIKCCAPRLAEFVQLANPRVIVCVGKVAEDWLDPAYRHSVKLHRDIPRIAIRHPAAILRANLAQRGLLEQRCVVQIRNAAEEYCTWKEEER